MLNFLKRIQRGIICLRNLHQVWLASLLLYPFSFSELIVGDFFLWYWWDEIGVRLHLAFLTLPFPHCYNLQPASSLPVPVIVGSTAISLFIPIFHFNCWDNPHPPSSSTPTPLPSALPRPSCLWYMRCVTEGMLRLLLCPPTSPQPGYCTPSLRLPISGIVVDTGPRRRKMREEEEDTHLQVLIW